MASEGKHVLITFGRVQHGGQDRSLLPLLVYSRAYPPPPGYFELGVAASTATKRGRGGTAATAAAEVVPIYFWYIFLSDHLGA